jgi:hypothetical protein
LLKMAFLIRLAVEGVSCQLAEEGLLTSMLTNLAVENYLMEFCEGGQLMV